MSCPVIVFANHKGGVGKTTCSVLLSEIIAKKHKKKVLVIDCDSQGNTSEALSPFGVVPSELPSLEICMENPEKTEYCIIESWHKNIYFIANNISMEKPFPSYAPNKVNLPFIYRVPLDSIAQVCEKTRSKFDFIVIDTAPSLGLTTQSALYAADVLFTPCSTATHAIFGLPDILRLSAMVKKIEAYVVITLIDRRTNMDKIGRNKLMSQFPCIGEVPKINRVAENLYTKKYLLNKVPKDKADVIEDLVENMLSTAQNIVNMNNDVITATESVKAAEV
jgi:chromosome partitioning protein